MVDRRETDRLPDTPDPSAGNHSRRRPGGDIAKAHADFVMALAARKPAVIALEPHPEDFTARAICCEALIDRVRLHLTALIEDAAESDPSRHIRDAALTASIDAHRAISRATSPARSSRWPSASVTTATTAAGAAPFYRRR